MAETVGGGGDPLRLALLTEMDPIGLGRLARGLGWPEVERDLGLMVGLEEQVALLVMEAARRHARAELLAALLRERPALAPQLVPPPRPRAERPLPVVAARVLGPVGGLGEEAPADASEAGAGGVVDPTHTVRLLDAEELARTDQVLESSVPPTTNPSVVRPAESRRRTIPRNRPAVGPVPAIDSTIYPPVPSPVALEQGPPIFGQPTQPERPVPARLLARASEIAARSVPAVAPLSEPPAPAPPPAPGPPSDGEVLAASTGAWTPEQLQAPAPRHPRPKPQGQGLWMVVFAGVGLLAVFLSALLALITILAIHRLSS
jgi:hypothetical protein